MIVYTIFVDNGQAYEDRDYSLHSIYATEEVAKAKVELLNSAYRKDEYNYSMAEVKEYRVRESLEEK